MSEKNNKGRDKRVAKNLKVMGESQILSICQGYNSRPPINTHGTVLRCSTRVTYKFYLSCCYFFGKYASKLKKKNTC